MMAARTTPARGGGTAAHEYGRNWLSAGFLVLGRAVRFVSQRPAEAFRGVLGMTTPQPGSDGDELGPVDFLAIEFPGGRLTSPGFKQLLALANQGVVEILDMEFITKDADDKSKRLTSGSSPFPRMSTLTGAEAAERTDLGAARRPPGGAGPRRGRRAGQRWETSPTAATSMEREQPRSTRVAD